MVGGFSLLTPRRILLAFAVLVIAVGVAGRFAVAAESQGPSASFTFDPGAPLSGEQISFTSTSGDDGTIVSEDWDFDDGEVGSGSAVQHTYPIPGVYTVRLTVTDDESLTATHTDNVTVGNRNPSADFHHSPAAPEVGETVTFTSDASDPENRISVQRWDLDDDGTYDATGASVATVFTSGGPHSVTLLVEDQDGGTDTITKTVDVIDPPNQFPNAAFTFLPTDPMVLDTVTFTSSSNDPDGSIVSTEWDFENDGIFDATGTQVNHAYLFGGDYTVRLRITDNELAVKDLTKVVSVGTPPNDPPTANFSVSPSSPKTLENVTFESTSSDSDGAIVSYGWELDGDNDFDDHFGQSAGKVFSPSGTYPISLKVIDNDGASHVVTKNVVIANRPPTADFDFSPAAPKKNENITFTSLASDPENRIQFLEWDLDGDNQFDDAFGPTAQKSFDSPGSKTVRLRITDSDGGSDTATKTINVPSQPPTASFVYSPSNPLSLQAVIFTSTSSDPDGEIAQIRWDTDGDNNFNDDGSDIEAERTFPIAGSRTVRLRVTDDDGNTVTTSQILQIGNRAPTAVITAPTAALKNTNITFKSDDSATPSTDLDGSITKREWDIDNDGSFDDGTSAQITKSFSTTGPRTIRLRVTDNLGLTHVDVHVIDIGGNASPSASFTISPTATPVSYTDVTFNSTSTDSDGTIAKTEWDIDGDGVFERTGKTIVHKFTVPGPTSITMKVTDDDNSAQTLGKIVTVLNQGPSASIKANPTAPVSLLPVVFTATAADLDGSITSRMWDFDNDGAFDDGIGESVPWTFPRKGSYTVKVKVTDNSGASAQATSIVTVANTLPLAAFSYSPASPNPRQPVTLTSTSTDPDDPTTPPSVAWDLDNDGAFDDGTTPQVVKAFTTPGSHTVRLLATDADGGQSVPESLNIVVGNRPPTASFDFRPAAPIAGQLVTFFSTADDPDKNIERVDWDLDGDGAYDASGASASRTFSAGSFNVSMRVTDTSDSFAIVTQTIVVGVPPAAPKGDTRLRALTPFPIVRMAGSIGKRGTKFRVLTVEVPGGSTVTVRCSGKGCPFSKSTRAASVTRKLRIRKLENRLLRNGVLVKIFVTKAGTIGKYTSIKIRGGKPPKRVDRCLMPGSTKPTKCQS
jgi:PKD repeat protein